MMEEVDETRSPAPALPVLVAAFSCGWALMSVEILGGRVLAPDFGSSVFTWGSLISTFLVALSLGYLMGGALSRRRPRMGVLLTLMIVSGLIVLSIPWYSERICEHVFTLDLGEKWGPLLAAVYLFGLPAVILGMVSPYCVRLGASRVESVGATSGSLYAVSTIGSTLGTLVTTFWLIPEMGVKSIFQWTGTSLVALALILGLGTTLFEMMRRRADVARSAAAIVVLALALCALAQAGFAAERVLLQKDSVYSRIIVTEEGTVRILRSARRGVAAEESRMDTRAPLVHLNEYTGMMFTSLIFVPQPRDILVVGLGGGIIPRTLRHHFPQAAIDNVELDPMVIDVARQYFAFRTDPRMTAVASDGRVYTKRCRKQYDIVFLDAFQGSEIPFHLKTREYFEELKKVLRPGGVVVSNLHRGPRLYSAERQTYRAAFPLNYAFAGARSGNLILVSSPGGSPLSRQAILDRAQALQATHRFSFDLAAQAKKMQERVDWDTSVRVLTDDFAPVETLNR